MSQPLRAVPNQPEPEEQAVRVTRTGMAAFAMLCGAVGGGIGAGVAWGIGPGLFAFSMMLFVLGVLLGVGS